jgi:hypothetical protein
MITSSLCKRSALLFFLCTGFCQSAAAQTPPKQRPFDRIPGILVACAPAPGVAWTEQGCAYLIAESKKRAAMAKVPIAAVESTPYFSNQKLGTIDSFDGDKAIRMYWICKESKDKKGQVSVELASKVIYEPSAKDFPNQPNIQVAPGQRIPANFFTMQVTFDPGVKLRDAQSSLNVILDSFFEVGEGKL